MEVDPGFRKRVPFSFSVGERKIMNHFVVYPYAVDSGRAGKIFFGRQRILVVPHQYLRRMERRDWLSRIFFTGLFGKYVVRNWDRNDISFLWSLRLLSNQRLAPGFNEKDFVLRPVAGSCFSFPYFCFHES